MLEWGVWVSFGFIGILGIAGMAVAVYPLRKRKKLVFLLVPTVTVVLVISYVMWGGGLEWQAFQIVEKKQREAKRVIEALGSVEAVVARLKKRLSEDPKDAKAWFLLGRVYASSGNWRDAKGAYVIAHGLLPKNHEYTLHYAESIWELNDQTFDDKTRALLISILQENPRQPDALAMLAYDAYTNEHHKEAAVYWERLLEQVDPSTEEAAKIQQAIVKARDHS
jgi:cytochrome c-type biogenesis protein CcmH